MRTLSSHLECVAIFWLEKIGLSVVRGVLVFLSLLLLSVKLIAHPTVVVIDPGHGGIDRGGMPGQRLPEKPYTLDVAKRLARILDGTDDIKVVLTRTGDYFVPLPWRTAIANREVGHRAVFVSIHFNAGWRQGAYGIETYYNNSRGYRLAVLIHPRVIQALGALIGAFAIVAISCYGETLYLPF